MTADLITQLLEGNPDKRPELEDIVNHIFVSGRMESARLLPIEKTTKNVQMSIDTSGNIVLCFLKDKLTISSTADGLHIAISSPNTQKKQYSFYELPQCYWKRYSFLIRFIKLVQGKTAKITVHCGKWFKESGAVVHKEYISKCALMENGNFEVTLHNTVLNEDFKFLLDEHLSKNLERYRGKLNDLRKRLIQVESEFTELSIETKNDLFPISFGLNDKVQELYNKDRNGTRQRHSSGNKETSKALTNSQVLRSMQINGIGMATQVSALNSLNVMQTGNVKCPFFLNSSPTARSR